MPRIIPYNMAATTKQKFNETNHGVGAGGVFSPNNMTVNLN